MTGTMPTLEGGGGGTNSRASEKTGLNALTAQPGGQRNRPGTPPDVPLTQPDVAALIEKDYVGLRLLLTRRCNDPQVAADLLNEAICTAWAKWQAGKVARPEQIAGYVFQVAMNLLRNHRRAAAERPDRRADSRALEELQTASGPTDATIEAEIAERVKRVIRALGSARDRSILVRFYLNEEEKRVICADLGLTSLQFDKVLHRARERLRKLLETEGFQGSGDLYCLSLLA